MLDTRELAVACRLNALFAERFQLSRRLADPEEGELAGALKRFAVSCEQIALAYEAAWLARNKPSFLHEITTVFHRLAGEARAFAKDRSSA